MLGQDGESEIMDSHSSGHQHNGFFSQVTCYF